QSLDERLQLLQPLRLEQPHLGIGLEIAAPTCELLSQGCLGNSFTGRNAKLHPAAQLDHLRSHFQKLHRPHTLRKITAELRLKHSAKAFPVLCEKVQHMVSVAQPPLAI